MHDEGQGHEARNHDQNSHNHHHHHPPSTSHGGQKSVNVGHSSNEEEDNEVRVLRRHRRSDGESSDGEENSSAKGSSGKGSVQGGGNNNKKHVDMSGPEPGGDGKNRGVHFHEKEASRKSRMAPALRRGTHHPGIRKVSVDSESDDAEEDLKRASWTTASFTEVPNALDELETQHHPSKTRATIGPKTADDKRISTATRRSEKHGSDNGSASDLHSVMVKHGQAGKMSVLSKYIKAATADEAVQAGVPSWDWLSRLEQLLIHFFLVVFESKDDKLMMEMMPSEANSQVEEIFQLLLKAEPDMYKELGHLVNVAENWLIYCREDSEKKEKAMEYVRQYMQGVKDKNYYKLPIQVRLHKLGAFIAGLNEMGKGGKGKPGPIRYPVEVDAPPINEARLKSPRVKPATHFSRVVANILSGRPCTDPIPCEGVYADKLGETIFKNTLHGDKEFKIYTDTKYGDMFLKADLFSPFLKVQNLGDDDESGAGGDAGGGNKLIRRDDCVENRYCWIPKYTHSYIENLTGECAALAKKDFETGIAFKHCKGGRKDADCKVERKREKGKRLYEWVRGPDGKVHRRPVGSYAELGVGADNRVGGSLDNLGRGGGGRGRKGGRDALGVGGPMQSKATSDTRLGKRDYGVGSSPRGKGDYGVGSPRGKGHGTQTGGGPGGRGHGGKGGGAGYSPGRGGGHGPGYSPSRAHGPGYSPSRAHGPGYSPSRAHGGRGGGAHGHNGQGPGYGQGGGHGQGGPGYGQGQGRGRGQGGPGYAAGPYGPGFSTAASQAHGMAGIASVRNEDGMKSVKHADGFTRLDEFGNASIDSGVDGHRGFGKGGSDDEGRRGAGNKGRDKSTKGLRAQSTRGVRGGGGKSGRGQDSGYDGRSRRDQTTGTRGGGGLGTGGSFARSRTKSIQAGQGKGRKSMRKNRFWLNEWEGEDFEGGDYLGMLDDGKFDDPQLLTLNRCWEKASKLFKRPNKSLVIPPAENLILYLESKYTKLRWPKGNPVATRHYPNGSIFVAQYGNGASRVFYPHGGLAVDISGPSPVYSQVLVVRDPSDSVFFFDKALLAELHSSGKGTVYGEDGVVKVQYSAIGGFKLDGQDGLEKGQRWQWNNGGQRIVMKLNKFISLRLSDQDRVFLNYYGNSRGFLVNVASGHEVILMNPKRRHYDPMVRELKSLLRPKTPEDRFDYVHGRFIPRPSLGFIDKKKHYMRLIEVEDDDNCGPPQEAPGQGGSNSDHHQCCVYDSGYEFAPSPIILEAMQQQQQQSECCRPLSPSPTVLPPITLRLGLTCNTSCPNYCTDTDGRSNLIVNCDCNCATRTTLPSVW